jgi:hypothetical protein
MRLQAGCWLMTGALCLFAACGHLTSTMAGSGSAGLPLKILYSGQTCPCQTSQPELTWFDSRQGLAQFMRQVNQGLLGPAGNLADRVDFSTYRVLAIAMGRKPTAGFSLVLIGEQAGQLGDAAEIHVQWNEPSKGVVAAQMLTSPCLLIELPRGKYTQVRVKDQNDCTRASLILP